MQQTILVGWGVSFHDIDHGYGKSEGGGVGGSGRTFGALPAQTLVIHHVLGPLDAVASGVGVGAA